VDPEKEIGEDEKNQIVHKLYSANGKHWGRRACWECDEGEQ